MSLTSKTPRQRLASHTNTERLTKKTTQGKKPASTLKLGRNGVLLGLLNEFLQKLKNKLLAQENQHLRWERNRVIGMVGEG